MCKIQLHIHLFTVNFFKGFTDFFPFDLSNCYPDCRSVFKTRHAGVSVCVCVLHAVVLRSTCKSEILNMIREYIWMTVVT